MTIVPSFGKSVLVSARFVGRKPYSAVPSPQGTVVLASAIKEVLRLSGQALTNIISVRNQEFLYKDFTTFI